MGGDVCLWEDVVFVGDEFEFRINIITDGDVYSDIMFEVGYGNMTRLALGTE